MFFPILSSAREARETLTLVPFYCGEREDLIASLASEVSSVFGVRVERHSPGFDPEESYDPSRGQYDTRSLLQRLLSQQPGAGKILGVTDVDLFIPILTFVFGEAQMGGRAAVVSTQRLAPERYGLPADLGLLQQRLFKEAIHELGHTYELVHCENPRCVMASSSAVEGIDLKSSRFCSACAQGLSARAPASGRLTS